jgi:hypothetical protein
MHDLGVLITERNTGHTILDTKNVIVDRVYTVKLITTRGVGQAELGVIDAREVKGASGLHLAEVDAEWPCVSGKILENIVGEVSAVHFWYDCVMVHGGSFFE